MSAEISITLKGKASSDPWIVIRADSVQEAHKMLAEVHEQDVYTAAGRAKNAFQRGINAGDHLDATTVTVKPAEDKKADKAPAKEDKPATQEQAPVQDEAPKKKPPKPAWA